MNAARVDPFTTPGNDFSLTAGVAHDFNNLLAVVNGSTTLMSMDKALPDTLRQHLDRISAAGVQAAKLISRLAGCRRGERGGKPLSWPQ